MECLFVALFLVVSVAGVFSAPCDKGWSFYHKDNKCIKTFTDTKSWHDAGSKCKKQGARLVVIPDLATQTFVNNVMGKAISEAWIGLSDLSNEKIYTWSDGSHACKFRNWGYGEPNNEGNEDCVHLLRGATHKWNDRPCTFKSPYICEKKGPGCRYKNGGCPEGCTQNAGNWGVTCTCKTGYARYHGICMDVNECSIKNGGCDQFCENTVGSFHCQCYTDFVYDGKKCVLDTGDTVVG